VWRQKTGWMRSSTVESVNAALSVVPPYKYCPGTRKEPFGSNAKIIKDQYAKFAPRQFAPDKFEVATDGHSGMAARLWQQTTTSTGDSKSTELLGSGPGSTAAIQNVTTTNLPPVQISSSTKVRWSAMVHSKPLSNALPGPPFIKHLPQRPEDRVLLARKMPVPKNGNEWDTQTITCDAHWQIDLHRT